MRWLNHLLFEIGLLVSCLLQGRWREAEDVWIWILIHLSYRGKFIVLEKKQPFKIRLINFGYVFLGFITVAILSIFIFYLFTLFFK